MGNILSYTPHAHAYPCKNPYQTDNPSQTWRNITLKPCNGRSNTLTPRLPCFLPRGSAGDKLSPSMSTYEKPPIGCKANHYITCFRTVNYNCHYQHCVTVARVHVADYRMEEILSVVSYRRSSAANSKIFNICHSLRRRL